MNKNIYNIIWADDDSSVYDISDFYFADILRDENINIIGTAQNGLELKQLLVNHLLETDAVIIDANFNKRLSSPNNENDISGLIYCSDNIYDFCKQKGKYLPFILFTARNEDKLREACNDGGYLDSFCKDVNWFEKGVDKCYFFQKVKNLVDYYNSDIFILRNKYRLEFEAAELIPDASRLLIKTLEISLHKSRNIEYKDLDIQDLFNPARMIFERIKDKCIEERILPKLPLNSIPRFLNLNVVGPFTPINRIMGKPLVHSLRYFLDITQDGSHDDCDLELGVNQYVRENENMNLFMVIMHIVMDLLLWYKRTHDQIEENSNFCVDLWIGTYEHEGHVFSVRNKCGEKVFYLDQYYLGKNEKLSDGDYIGIFNSESNRNDPTKRVAWKNGYLIIEKSKDRNE